MPLVVHASRTDNPTGRKCFRIHPPVSPALIVANEKHPRYRYGQTHAFSAIRSFSRARAMRVSTAFVVAPTAAAISACDNCS
jgi:hypothetical protein